MDFICSGAALIVEVDGDAHLQQAEADQEREQLLTELCFIVIRFTNEQVLEETDKVLQEIQNALKGTPSPKSSKPDFGEGVGG